MLDVKNKKRPRFGKVLCVCVRMSVAKPVGVSHSWVDQHNKASLLSEKYAECV